MIKVSFRIVNPFSKDLFTDIYNRSGKITKNKSWEIQVWKQAYTFLEVDIDTCVIGQDHAGIGIVLGLFSYVVCAKIYDNRHWDYENNCWGKYEDRD